MNFKFNCFTFIDVRGFILFDLQTDMHTTHCRASFFSFVATYEVKMNNNRKLIFLGGLKSGMF